MEFIDPRQYEEDIHFDVVEGATEEEIFPWTFFIDSLRNDFVSD